MMKSYCRAAALVVSSLALGCTVKPTEPAKPQYTDLGAKTVPDFLKNTIWEQVDLANASPMRVNGYGLVVNLDGTGDTRAPGPVRDYMLKQMQKHGFGSSVTGLATLGPEQVLNDKDRRTAIVRVEGFIPPGAHQGQAFDVQVTALENSNTTSLHRGELYEADLAPRGADPFNPGGGLINPMATVKSGPIAINPAYVLHGDKPSPADKMMMTRGVVMNRAVVGEERPLALKLRQPERRLAKQIEARINERFQDSMDERFGPVMNGGGGYKGSRIAVARDEGEIWLYVPYKYGTDWERFVGVVMHLYFSSNNEFATLQARGLADIALRDGDKAPLLDISYCWEALGAPAIPALTGLYANTVPSVAYAAARAGAYLGDIGAQEALARMARTADHPFQTTAVEVLGSLPSTAQLRTTLRGLLDSDSTPVRIAAYNAMVASGDPMIVSTYFKTGRFTLDQIQSDKPPLIYATRTGEPRIAILGRSPKVLPPGLLMTMNNRLTVSADAQLRGVSIFYRDKYGPAVEQACAPDLAVVIGRLGGDSADPAQRLRFQYTDVVGIVQKMVEDQMVTAVTPQGTRLKAVVEVQPLPGLDDPILTAPTIPEQRPQDVPTTQNVAVR